MSRITRTLLALALLALGAPASAAADPAFVRVGTFDAPISATAPPRDTTRLFVVERAGTIRVVRRGTVLGTPFLDIHDEVDSDPNTERGLLSMTFAPDYEQSGLFYVYMVAREPAGEIQVREYRRSAGNADVADPTGRIVFRAAHNEAGNHNGGQIEWGPDGYLWFATGDGGSVNDALNHARDLGSPLGKVLRIDPRPGNAGSHSIPADNPFGTAVWAFGLRNPFRFSFDRETGDLWIGDVGQARREEVDLARAASGRGRGADYGWACREGTLAGPKACTPGAGYIPPVFDYDSVNGSHSVTGGFVARDPGLPTLNGRYVYADFFDPDIRSFVPADPRGTDVSSGLTQNAIASFGEDACGHLYVVSLNGSVDRVQDGAIGACVLKPQPPPLPAAPGPPAGGVARPRVPDRTSPRLRIRVARRGRVGRRATPRIAITATENCRAAINAHLAGTKLKRVRTPLRGGKRTIVRLRPKAKAIKRIHRALRRHRRVTMRVSVIAVDAAGNTGRLTRWLRVRRGG
jgi:hypothetical protein